MNCQILPEFTWNTWENRTQGENEEGPSAPCHRVMRGILTHFQTFLLTSHPGNNATCQKRDCCFYTFQVCAGCRLFSKSASGHRWSYTHYTEGTNGKPGASLAQSQSRCTMGRGLNSTMTPNLDEDFCVPLSITRRHWRILVPEVILLELLSL